MSTPAPRVLYVAEPPAAWLERPPVVVDCSVVAALLFDEPDGDEAATRLLDRVVHAPGLLPYEIANVARSKARAGADPAWIAEALAEFAELRIALHGADPAAMAALADRYDLTAYDAAYLHLAESLGAPLATFDRKLAQAAGRHLGSSGR